jgi:hypothetical protein
LSAIVVIALLMGACGDDDSDSAESTTATTKARAATSDSPVRVMVLETSGGGMPVPDLMAGALAAEKALADSPRPIEIVRCKATVSGPGDTAGTMACVRNAIDSHVAAFLGTAPEDGSELLKAAGISSWPQNPLSKFELNDPTSFVPTGGSQLQFAAQGVAAVKYGGPRVAIVGFDIEQAAPLIENAIDGVEGAGGKVVAKIFVPFQAVDVSPQIQQIDDVDADSVLIITTEDVLANIVRTIGQFGLDVTIAVPAGGQRNETLDALGPLAKRLVAGASLPFVNINGKNPDVLKQYIADMKAAGSFSEDLVRVTGLRTWINLYAISRAAERVEGDVDGPALLRALEDPKPLDVPVMGEWVPSANGPLEEYPRISSGTGYLLRYVGDGTWETLKPQNGLSLFDLIGNDG